MKATVVIPARFASERLPGKVIRPILGRPMIQYVYEGCRGASLVDEVVVATDSEEVIEVVESFGGTAILTSPEHPSGTDRVAEVVTDRPSDIVVNVQGDEPMIRPEMVDEVVRVLLEEPSADIGTLVKQTEDPGEVFSPDVVKVVFDDRGFALYFSRSPIPYYRDEVVSKRDERGVLYTPPSRLRVYKHIGIYSYRKESLLRFVALKQGWLERAERLEQLRALQNGMRIKVRETPYETIGVDTEEDLRRVEEFMRGGP